MFPGFPAFFLLIFVAPFVFGIITMIMRMNAARNLARRSGMDPEAAATMSMLTNDGLSATYLAANLRNNTPMAPMPTTAQPQPAPLAPEKPPAERLNELKDLHTKGLITESEYQARRQQIINSV